MAFSLSRLAQDAGDSVYYEAGFRTVIESHLNILRVHPQTRREIISADKVYQYEGDFYGLLGEMGISLELRWIYLRVNHMENSFQFGRMITDPYVDDYRFTLIHPPEDLIDELRMLYLTIRD